MNFDLPLTKNNFLLYAVKHYNNPQCFGVQEFNSDMKKFSYVKRLLKKHKNGKDINYRLLLNHIISLYNVFGAQPINRLLFFYCDRDSWPSIISMLSYLSILSNHIPEISNSYLKSDPIMTRFLESL